MSTANLNPHGYSSTLTLLTKQPTNKAQSEGAVTAAGSTAQTIPQTERTLTVPAVAAATRAGGDVNGSASLTNGGGGQPARQHESSGHGGGAVSTAGGYGALSLAPQRRKRTDGGTIMTLFVRGKDSTVSDGNTFEASLLSRESPGSPGARDKKKGDKTDKAAVAVAAAAAEAAAANAPLAVLESAVSAVTSTPEKIAEALPTFTAALAKPVVTAAAVFIFFVVVDLYTLLQARRTTETLIEAATAINDQLLTLSVGLTEQHAMKEEYAKVLAEPYRRTPPADIERAVGEVQQLASAKNRSLTSLRRHLAYPGPQSDIAFLVEQHVAYERNLQRLAEAELEWMRVAQNAVHTRIMGRRTTRVVIGDNADRHLNSLSEVARKHLEHMTYPLREEREVRKLRRHWQRSDEAAAAAAGTLDGVNDAADEEARVLAKDEDEEEEDADSAASAEEQACLREAAGGYSAVRGQRVNAASVASQCRKMADAKRTTAPASTPTKKKPKRRRAKERDFDAFVEVQSGSSVGSSPVGTRHTLEEVSVSAHPQDEDDDSEAKGQALVASILDSRLAVFLMVCVLTFLYYRVG